MPLDDDEEETHDIEFNHSPGPITTHGPLANKVSITQNFGMMTRDLILLMEQNNQISEERNKFTNLERFVYRLEPHIKNMVRTMNSNNIPLTKWLVKHGYTDPDAEWDFPPPDSENQTNPT